MFLKLVTTFIISGLLNFMPLLLTRVIIMYYLLASLFLILYISRHFFIEQPNHPHINPWLFTIALWMKSKVLHCLIPSIFSRFLCSNPLVLAFDLVLQPYQPCAVVKHCSVWLTESDREWSPPLLYTWVTFSVFKIFQHHPH